MIFTTLTRMLTEWRRYRQTATALEALDTRGLDDLGIGRWRIPDIARRSAR